MRSRTRTEDGFTLMELIVAMLLLVLVMGGLVYAVTQFSRSNGKAMNDRAAQRQALDALEQLRSDVRAARSPGLDSWDYRREALRDIVRFPNDPQVQQQWGNVQLEGCGTTGAFECIRDVTFADGRQVWFRADVRTELAGIECVGYVVTATRLTRYVSANWRACGPGTGGAMKVLVEARQLPASPFRYVLTWNPTMVRNEPADPAGCVAQSRASVAGIERNYISAIDLDLTGVGVVRSERATATNAGVRTSAQITGRTGGDYAFAVGCSY